MSCSFSYLHYRQNKINIDCIFYLQYFPGVEKNSYYSRKLVVNPVTSRFWRVKMLKSKVMLLSYQ